MPIPTPWSRGRLDRRALQKSLLFGSVYEDAAIDLKAHPPGGRVFCIASAGCTAIRLAQTCHVTAVDINPVQLDYAARRATGSPMETGTAEKILRLGRWLMASAGWTERRLDEFLELAIPTEQLAYWQSHLRTRRFLLASQLLLSSRPLSVWYSPDLLSVIPAQFPRVLVARLERCWAVHPNQSNPYARLLLRGKGVAMPATSSRPAAIDFVCCDAAAYLESCPAASFDGFSISNILDGASPGYLARLEAAIVRAASNGAKIVVRSFSEQAPLCWPGENIAAEDRCPLWGSVQILSIPR